MGGGTVKVIAETVDEQGWSCTVYFGQDDEARDAMRAFSDQLRTGQLVAVADDAIERVARAILRAKIDRNARGYEHLPETFDVPFAQDYFDANIVVEAMAAGVTLP